MKVTQFNAILDQRVRKMRDTLTAKRADYAPGGDDALHNFRVASLMNGRPMEVELWGFLTKHLVSLRDGVLGTEERVDTWWDEKIGDAINYLVLLEACIAEAADETRKATRR